MEHAGMLRISHCRRFPGLVDELLFLFLDAPLSHRKICHGAMYREQPLFTYWDL